MPTMTHTLFTLGLFFIPSVMLYSILEDTWKEGFYGRYMPFLVVMLLGVTFWVAIWGFVGTWGWVQ